MNFFKGVFGFGNKGRHSENFLEYKGTGRLFLIQNGKRKCVFITSQISFIQGKKDAYERYIYVKNLSDQSEFNTDEYYFSINEGLKPRSYQKKDDDEEEVIGFEWDLDNGVTVSYEFEADDKENPLGAEGFKYHICRLIYENKYRKAAASASEEELEQFCKERAPEPAKKGSGLLKSHQDEEVKIREPEKEEAPTDELNDELSKPMLKEKTLEWNKQKVQESVNSEGFDELIRNFDKADIEKEKQAKPEEPEEIKINEAKKGNPFGTTEYKREEGQSLMEIKCSLCEVNENGQLLVLIQKANLYIVDAENFQYYFEVFDENMNILYKRLIQTDLNYYVDDEQSSFKWVEISLATGDIAVYGCIIPKDLINSFKLLFAQCLYEATNQESVEASFKKEEERQYVRGWFENDTEKVEEIKSQEKDEIEIEDDYFAADNVSTGQYTGQTQAKVLDRTFVSQGPTISVFMTNDDDNSLDYIVSLPPVKTLEGSEFFPKKMLMHEQDTKMLMLSDPEGTKVYYMDLAKGKIINEYEGDGENRFTDLAPVSKHSEFTHNPCFITSNQRNLFLIDPRVSDKNKCVAEKIYASAPKFTCISTTDNEGQFATGSEKGEIRLYTKVGQNAKTLFPGFGDPIISLDSTKDGAWLLATTKTYLMLMTTVINGKSGYKQSISKDAKVPFRLTILPEDIKKYKIIDLSFQPAKFNDNENSAEKFIMASTGEFLVTWNLKDVLRGHSDKYDIKRLSDYIVSNEFRYKREDDLLVTLPKEVRVQKTRFHK